MTGTAFDIDRCHEDAGTDIETDNCVSNPNPFVDYPVSRSNADV